MTRPRPTPPSPRRRDPDAAAPLERALHGDLRGTVKVPDQTAAIMSRLGYRPVDDRAVRRSRRRRTSQRAVMSIAGCAVVAAAALLYGRSGLVRAPVGTTVPQALSDDIRREQQRLDRTMRMIRSLAPAPVQREPELPPLEEQLALAPVRFL